MGKRVFVPTILDEATTAKLVKDANRTQRMFTHEDMDDRERDLVPWVQAKAVATSMTGECVCLLKALAVALAKVPTVKCEDRVEVLCKPMIVGESATPAMFSVMSVPYVYLYLAVHGVQVPFLVSVKAKGLSPRAVSSSASASAERQFR